MSSNIRRAAAVALAVSGACLVQAGPTLGPSIAGLSPTRGSTAGGQIVTIKGSGFGNTYTGRKLKVDIGGVECSVLEMFAFDDSILCSTGAAPSARSAVSVTVDGVTSPSRAYYWVSCGPPAAANGLYTGAMRTLGRP